MSKRRLYIFSLWVATLGVLLSTVMMHHHHMGRICMVMEQCERDGNYNDQHTEHHENEQEGCRVHQMHHFVTNAKVVKSIKLHILGADLLGACLNGSQPILVPCLSLVAVRWQHAATPLQEWEAASGGRRGPPIFS